MEWLGYEDDRQRVNGRRDRWKQSESTGAVAVLMLGEQGRSREGLRAPVAAVTFDVGVCLQVRSEVGAVGEGAVALLAAERSLAGVGS